MDGQIIMTASENYIELDNYLKTNVVKKVFLVCDSSLPFLRIYGYFKQLELRTGTRVIYFSNFKPNPLYASVVEGVKLFRKENCDLIMAVGGGSAMDVAKCIKLYSNMNPKLNYLKQTIIANDVKLLAVPTTAGTGSEATCYAVIYYNGEKQSVTDCSCLPSAVLLDATTLETLPEYQKKATMMDALCHAIEAYWSVNSTKESKEYSKKAILSILENKDAYLYNESSGNAAMMKASNMAGKAINIAQTTAGHALCYKLTSFYGIAHGHAAALCVAKLWPFMVAHMEKCTDPRGADYLTNIFVEISHAMGCEIVNEAIKKFQNIFAELKLSAPVTKPEDFDLLKTSVNPVRLKNNPIELDVNDILILYHQILTE